MSDGSRNLFHPLEDDLKHANVTALTHRLGFDANHDWYLLPTTSRAITGVKSSIFARSNGSALFQIKWMCRGLIPEWVGGGQNDTAASGALAPGLRDV